MPVILRCSTIPRGLDRVVVAEKAHTDAAVAGKETEVVVCVGGNIAIEFPVTDTQCPRNYTHGMEDGVKVLQISGL